MARVSQNQKSLFNLTSVGLSPQEGANGIHKLLRGSKVGDLLLVCCLGKHVNMVDGEIVVAVSASYRMNVF